MRKVFYCPAVIGFAASLVEEIKEIAEIIVTRPREAISAISALSVGHYYLMRIVFYCPAEIKEIKEIFIPLSAKPFLLFLPFLWDYYYLMWKVFLLSHGNKRNQGNLHPPRRSPFCPFCPFCGALLSHADSNFLSRSHRLCRFARRRNEGNKGNSSFGCCLRSAFGLKTSGLGTIIAYFPFIL